MKKKVRLAMMQIEWQCGNEHGTETAHTIGGAFYEGAAGDIEARYLGAITAGKHRRTEC